MPAFSRSCMVEKGCLVSAQSSQFSDLSCDSRTNFISRSYMQEEEGETIPTRVCVFFTQRNRQTSTMALQKCSTEKKHFYSFRQLLSLFFHLVFIFYATSSPAKPYSSSHMCVMALRISFSISGSRHKSWISRVL